MLDDIDDKQPSDNDGEATVTYWVKQLDAYKKKHADWVKKGWKTVEKYRDEKKRNNSQFNILWSNTETLKASLYSSTPVPSVTRRYKDADPVGLQVSEVLKRSLSYSIDCYDFDDVMESVVEDYCLPGRGQARIKYIPHFEEKQLPQPVEPIGYTVDMMGQQQPQYPEGTEFSQEIGPFVLGEPEEVLVYEEVHAEYVFWEDFAFDAKRKWKDTKWVAFKGLYTRERAVKEFGEIGYKLSLDYVPTEESSRKKDEPIESEAIVWEIWDKEKRKQLFIAPGYQDGPLKVEDDPLNLLEFFPCPKPITAVVTTDTTVPVPLYCLYQDQAEELNKVTARITALISRLKVTGAYNAVNDALTRISEAEDGHLEPLQGLGPDVRLDDMVTYWPIDKIAQVLAGLYNQRQEIKQIIYDLTGLSDLMRGQTDPNETAAAQQLKGKFGNLRQSPRQKAIQKFARDLFRLAAEVMSEKFKPETLSMVANMPVTPEMIELMRNDHYRTFRIDIETDSTIEPNAAEEQQNRMSMVQSVTEMITAWAPLVQGGMPPGIVKSLALFAIRSFKNSREVEEAIEKLPDQPPAAPQGPSPEEMKIQAQMAADKIKITADANLQSQKIEADKQLKTQQYEAEKAKAQMQIDANFAIEQQRIQLEDDREIRKIQSDERIFAQEIAMKQRLGIIDAIIKAQSMAASAKESEEATENDESELEVDQLGGLIEVVKEAMQAFSAPKQYSFTKDAQGNIQSGMSVPLIGDING